MVNIFKKIVQQKGCLFVDPARLFSNHFISDEAQSLVWLAIYLRQRRCDSKTTGTITAGNKV